MNDTERIRVCPTCKSENIEDCPEDPYGRWRCEDCDARVYGPKIRYVDAEADRDE